MTSRIPEDAFEQYVALGAARSHKALAEQLGVSKRAVAKRAVRDGWSERLAKIEKEVRNRTDEKITETLEQMRERHLITLKFVHKKALQGLAQYPITSGMEAVRAAEIAIKLERLVLGDPSERTAVSIEELHKNEIERLLIPVTTSADDSEAEG